MASRSAGMVERGAAELDRSATHPLLTAMSDGSIAASTFERYLVLEGAFVLSAARAIGAVIAAERDEATMRVLTGMLSDLLDEQRDYFARATGDLSSAGSTPLHELVEQATAGGDVPAIIVAMSAAETLYERWCGDAPEVKRDARVQEWIDIHTSSGFRRGAAFWRALVDRISVESADDARLDELFIRALHAENEFHSFPLKEHLWT